MNAHAEPGRRPGLVSWLIHEFLEMLPVVAYFAVGFLAIISTTNLILAQYSVSAGSFAVAITAALVVGKAVLVANATPFLRRYDTMPLAWTILYKTVLYCVFASIAHFLELVIEDLIQGKPLSDAVATFSWHRFLAIQIWLFVLFIVFVTVREMSQLMGEGELRQLLFRRRSAGLIEGRRARSRALMRLNHLTEAHGLHALTDPGSPAHAEVRDILRTLAGKPDQPAR